MSAHVVTKDEHDALAAEVHLLKRKLEQLVDGGGQTARAYLTPKQVAKRHGVRAELVYHALESGRMKAEARPGRGHARFWMIQPSDAQTWYDAFVKAAGNR